MKIEEIDNFILKHFSSSFMNNSKWEKLLESLISKLVEIHVNYKLVYDEKIVSTSLTSTDFKPFFIEPIYYKELEWIEFPKTVVIQKNQKLSKKYFQESFQDIDLIEKTINEIGEYFYAKEENKITLYAYKK